MTNYFTSWWRTFCLKTSIELEEKYDSKLHKSIKFITHLQILEYKRDFNWKFGFHISKQKYFKWYCTEFFILGSTIRNTFIIELNTKGSLHLVYKLWQHARSDKNGSVPYRGCDAWSASFIQTKNIGQTSRSGKAASCNSKT